MSDFISQIDYDALISRALKNVLKDALKIVERQGLPGEHHFYISFRTDHPKTEVPAIVKSQYPKEMTIVLQHYFKDLHVEEDKFSIQLSFGSVPYDLVIPFEAITRFQDPSTNFALVFPEAEDEEDDLIDDTEDMGLLSEAPKKVSNEGHGAVVVSLDEFKKRRK
ncbi:MAG: ClpXP protease specificity-enhancing factor SspB [Alphaproteobacteria bacterium]|nr:ClpXP protease specificity-enhancing factor SspB [Alphaproteobacteria bacterium]